MSSEPFDTAIDADALLARASGAEARARSLRSAMARDLLVPDEARLDDRRRATTRLTLYRTIDHYADAIIESASIDIEIDRDRLRAFVERRLADDLSVANDLIDRATLDLINDALPSGLVETTPWPPGLSPEDAAVAELHAGLVAAERQRGDSETFLPDLPAESQARFIWWTATGLADDRADLDQALANGARTVLARQDEGERPEAWAMRLAGRVDIAGDGLPSLIDHCLGERRLVFLTALIARGLRLDYEVMRAMIVDADDARLWLALRALDLPRETIARIGFVLGEADPRRDVEDFADRLDAIMSIGAASAYEMLMPLRLPLDYRLARAEGAGR